MLSVTLYTNDDCDLCDQAKADLEALQKDFPHRLAEVNIDSDPVLKSAYQDEIPVVEVGPYKLKAPFDKKKLRMVIGAASDRRSQLEEIGDEAFEARVERGKSVSVADKIMFWISSHYLVGLNFIMFVYVGLPFLAPVLMKTGASAPARIIYTIYSPLCHQFGFRSFFLSGQQPYYPLAEAGLQGILDFEEATGITNLHNPNDHSRLLARQYVGDESIGYKVALCERDVSIYGAILLFGLIFGLTRRKFPQLHWLVWILLGIGPIGLDGFSQLFSQFDWPALATFLPYRESTPFLRVLTGGMFGFFTAWFAYPNVEESMQETRQFFIKKFAHVKALAD